MFFCFIRTAIFSLIFTLCMSTTGLGQSAQEHFGKNRIQFEEFKWRIISTDNFDIYYDYGDLEVATLAAKHAQSMYRELINTMGFAPYDKIKLVVYETHSDLLQSNIGLDNQHVFTGGEMVFVKNRVEVAYEGKPEKFREDIRYGITSLIGAEMMYGGNLKEVVQSSYLLRLPEWFLGGLSAYVAQGWSIEMDDWARDKFYDQHTKKPQATTGHEAIMTGHSIWNFIVQQYGKDNIANILNMTRITRDEKSAIENALGMPYNTFLMEWRSYYQQMSRKIFQHYQLKQETFTHTHTDHYYGKIKISPDGNKFAYIENNKGKYKVVVRNINTDKKKVVYRGGYKSVNQQISYTQPSISWQNNKRLSFYSVESDTKYLFVHDFSRKRKPIIGQLILELEHLTNLKLNEEKVKRSMEGFNDQILSYDFSDDGKYVIFSATKEKKTDLFLYDYHQNKVKRLTNDFYTDLNPQFLPGTSGKIVFSSNRNSDTLSRGKSDYKKFPAKQNIFMLDIQKSLNIAKQLTQDSHKNTHPQVGPGNQLIYLSDKNGIFSLYKKDLNDSLASPQLVTNFRQNMQSYDYNFQNNTLAFIARDRGKKRIYIQKDFKLNNNYEVHTTVRKALEKSMKDIGNKQIIPPDKNNDTQKKQQKKKPAAPPWDTTLAKGEIDTEYYIFENEKKKKEKKLQNVTKEESAQQDESASSNNNMQENTQKSDEIYVSRSVGYGRSFTIKNIISSAKFDPLRGFGVVMEAYTQDILGNHRINGGVFASTDLRTSNMFAEYRYLKKRFDYNFRYNKDVIFVGDQSAQIFHRYKLNKFDFNVAYPFTPSSRISLSGIYSSARFTNLSGSPFFQNDDHLTHFAGPNLEYVFDNTLSMGMNMLYGTRMKMGATYNWGLGEPGQSFGKLYLDFRNYQRLHREIVLASRITGGKFIGPAKKDYLLGGMDNWAFDSTARGGNENPLSVPIESGNRDLLFNEYATNLRGFPYNAQNGSSFILTNVELRLPLIRYLFRDGISSSFFRNMQFIAFGDIGSAWTGIWPFDSNNRFNMREITSPPFNATVKNYKNPFLMGYGGGIRTMFMGYYTKLDVAQGVLNGINQDIMVYLTLGYDF